MSKKKSPIKELIKESIQELREKDFPKDPILSDDSDDDNENELSAPERFSQIQKRKDEFVIDELLADISNKEGYFIKLKKEVRPNEWMLMKVIESEWRRWADIETAIADIVKEYTKKSPQKWGSGTYRVEIASRGGFRGKRYNPIDIHVNADEEFITSSNTNSPTLTPPIDPSISIQSNLEQLGQLLNVVRNIVPSGPDPNILQQQIANAFQQGMQVKSQDSTNMTTLVVGMMTAMMTAMKDIVAANKGETSNKINNPEETLLKMLEVMNKFGVLNQKQEKSAIDFAKELQALGLDLFKKDEPLEQINKLKQIASIAADFMGMGGSQEKPSILEKIVDVLGPSIPNMIKDVKETWQTAQQLNQLKGTAPVKQLPNEKMNNVIASENGVNGVPQDQIKVFLNDLYTNIQANNKMYYPIIYTILCQNENGMQLLNGLVTGQKTAKEVIDLIQQYGDQRFKDSEFVMKKMVPYVNGFVVWIQSMVQPKVQNNTFDVECPLCHAIYSYETEEDFNNEQNKECGANGCKGILKPIKVVVQ